MTWTDVRDLDRARTVCVLPVGAVEAHGPHLPLTTDVIIAEAMAESGAEALARDKIPTVVLPPIAYTAAPFAAEFTGTMAARGEHVTALVVDVARATRAHGFAAIAIANAHLDPAHLESLRAAVDACERDGIACAFPDVTRKPWALRLGEEFLSGACHAGRYETSIVMAQRPDLVREDARRKLTPNPASLSQGIREGKRTFREVGGEHAYFGWPADASADEGRARIAVLGAILAESVRERLRAASI